MSNSFFIGKNFVNWKDLSLCVNTDDGKQVTVQNLSFGKTWGFLPVYASIEDALQDNYSPDQLLVINYQQAQTEEAQTEEVQTEKVQNTTTKEQLSLFPEK